MSEGFIPSHGGYKDLLSFQKAEIVYDATVRFCADYLNKYDRTVDQMVQAARSGKQNIVEGSMASGTSKEMEIKLTNVARASLEELLTDYRDFLRTRGFQEWDKNSKEALFVRRLSAGKVVVRGGDGTHGTKVTHGGEARGEPVTFDTFRPFFETRPPEVLANMVICLIHQTNYLLDQQIKRLEKDFIEQGGLRERMTRARLTERNKQGGWRP